MKMHPPRERQNVYTRLRMDAGNTPALRCLLVMHHRPCRSLGRREITDPRHAGYRRVEELFNVKNTLTLPPRSGKWAKIWLSRKNIAEVLRPCRRMKDCTKCVGTQETMVQDDRPCEVDGHYNSRLVFSVCVLDAKPIFHWLTSSTPSLRAHSSP